MKSFQDVELPRELLTNVQAMGFAEPTPIQAEAIPFAIAGRDILGSAQTGTGKTAAFGIPLAAKLLSHPKGKALIMTPTRELAAQVMKEIMRIVGPKSNIRSTLLVGGVSIFRQFSQLKKRPRIVVGTPGRINDHLERGTLKLHDASFLVLDETDRMLDMGFAPQVENILEHMREERQTLLFSATLPKNIVRIAKKYLRNPESIAVSPSCSPASEITQENISVKEGAKFTTLLDEVKSRDGSVIIFMRTKYSTEKLATRLTKEGVSAQAIHGDLKQSRRDRVIGAFRKSKYRVLVATDVAARGLDIPHIEHVINYDLPQCAEDYIHRIGRTARAGATGCALNLITSKDKGKWKSIERLLDPSKGADGLKRCDQTGKKHPKRRRNDKKNVVRLKKRNKKSSSKVRKAA